MFNGSTMFENYDDRYNLLPLERFAFTLDNAVTFNKVKKRQSNTLQVD